MSSGEDVNDWRSLLRRILPKRTYTRTAEIYNAMYCSIAIGPNKYQQLVKSSHSRSEVTGEEISISLPQLLYPLRIRVGTTDAIEVIHTVVRETYRVKRPRDARFIIDAGANIGDSTAWFLSRYPNATVVALEPDPENFRMLQRNCAPYGTRVILLHAALWSKDGFVIISGGDKSSIRVIGESQSSENSVSCCSLDSLMTKLDVPRIDIFKCDIEGAEREVFSCPGAWLQKTRLIYVDVHERETQELLSRVARETSFRLARYRELFILSR